MNKRRLNLALVVILLFLSFFLRTGGAQKTPELDPVTTEDPGSLDEGEELSYSSLEDVARYIHDKGHLPPNFITKKEAQELGWVASQGNLWEVAPGKSIGGDRFYNREDLLPEEEGRLYYECDIDYKGGGRGPRRLVYSSDGLIFYSEDHYASFREIKFD